MSKSRRSGAHEPPVDDGSGSFETYLEYNRVLRTWFVGFGIGGPALFLANGDVAKRLAEGQRLRLVVTLFLIGAGAQVVGSFINKLANFYMYRATIDESDNERFFYKFMDWLSGQFWIDVGLDLLTIGVFGWAAWLMLTVFAGDGGASAVVPG